MNASRPPRTSLLLVIVAVLVALTSIAAFFGSIWWTLDLVANFRPHFVVALGVLGLLLVVVRRGRVGIGVLLVALLNLAVVAPLFISPQPTVSGEEPSVRVMSFNVRGLNDRYEDVIAFIAAEKPDIVFLHEATFLWEDALAASDLPYRVERGRVDPLDFGTMALVPADASFQTFGFATSAPRAVEVTTTVGGVAVSILGIHPLSPSTAERARLRDTQIGFAMDWAAEGGGHRIVTGDFNATPWSQAFRRLIAHGELRNSQRGYGLELTFPSDGSPLVQVPIDHLLYSEGFAVVDRRLGPALGSDHFSLVVDLVVLDS